MFELKKWLVFLAFIIIKLNLTELSVLCHSINSTFIQRGLLSERWADIHLYKEQEEDHGLVVVFLENYKVDFRHVLFEVSLKCLEGDRRKEDSPVTPGKGLLQELPHYCSKCSGGTLPGFPCLIPATLL